MINDSFSPQISPKRYPVGVQSFEDIRSAGQVYVDKTALLYKLVTEGRYYFLSRPRRFGKSLTLSTLKAYFEGERQLFAGLEIESLEREWHTYPVIYLSLAKGVFLSMERTAEHLKREIQENATRLGVMVKEDYPENMFADLIRSTYHHHKSKVVVLVDEYDKPLLETQHADHSMHHDIHAVMRGFYSCIKDLGAQIHFAMITGVTKFSHLNIFSGLNNLIDISLNPAYNSLCGISESEIRRYFEEDIAVMAIAKGCTSAQIAQKLKAYYDGYRFAGKGDDIYNPYSLLNAFSHGEFDSYWYQSGNSSHLLEGLMKRPTFSYKKLEGYLATAEELMDPNLSYTHPIALLYQSGYLTIKDYDAEGGIYTLGFPNREVASGFATNLMAAITPPDEIDAEFSAQSLINTAIKGDADGMMIIFNNGLKSFKYDQLEAPRREMHFQLMLHIMGLCAGLRVESEVHTTHGRIDMVIKTQRYIYIMEFKKDKSVADAVRQLHEKNYADKYASDRRTLIEIGANFSTETRTLTGWEIIRKS